MKQKSTVTELRFQDFLLQYVRYCKRTRSMLREGPQAQPNTWTFEHVATSRSLIQDLLTLSSNQWWRIQLSVGLSQSMARILRYVIFLISHCTLLNCPVSSWNCHSKQNLRIDILERALLCLDRFEPAYWTSWSHWLTPRVNSGISYWQSHRGSLYWRRLL